MRTSWTLSISLATFMMTLIAMGAPTSTDQEGFESTANAMQESGGVSSAQVQTQQGIIPLASIDVRPSYYPDAPSSNGVDGFGTENSVEAGAQFTPNFALSYSQSFNTNIFQANSGKDIIAMDGFIKTNIANLWVSPDETLSLSYQNRLYLPTKASARDAGMITVIRNYVTLAQKVTDNFAMSYSLVPILHVYNRSGNGASANPLFENRIYVTPTINFTSKLSLSVPVMFHQSLSQTHNRQSNWTFFVWTWPELDYAIDENQTIGIAYQSDNLFTPTLGTLQPQSGGALQLVYNARL